MINSGEEKTPSWNDSSVKDSIIDFVEATTNNGPNYVKPADRIAPLTMMAHYGLKSP